MHLVQPTDTEVVSRMADLLEYALPGYWSAQALQSDVQQSASRYWLVERERAVVAFGGYWLIVDEAHLVILVVTPQYRRQGLGARLLRTMLRDARANSAHRMTLEVRATNIAALALYRQFGFETLGRRPGYYQDEDALILWTPRIDTPTYARLLDSFLPDCE